MRSRRIGIPIYCLPSSHFISSCSVSHLRYLYNFSISSFVLPRTSTHTQPSHSDMSSHSSTSSLFLFQCTSLFRLSCFFHLIPSFSCLSNSRVVTVELYRRSCFFFLFSFTQQLFLLLVSSQALWYYIMPLILSKKCTACHSYSFSRSQSLS